MSNIAKQLLQAETIKELSKAKVDWGVEGCVITVMPMEKGMGPPRTVVLPGKNQDVDKGKGRDKDKGRVGITENTAFPLASISKHITSLAIYTALDRVGLSWKTKVVDVLPDFGLGDGLDGKEVTVEDLLCHRTGMSGWDVMYAQGLNEGFLENIRNLPITSPPSYTSSTVTAHRTFQYNSLLYDLAARLIPALTNKTFTSFIQEEIFDPLRLSASYVAGDMPDRAKGKWTRVGQSGEREFVDVEYRLEESGEGWGAGRLWMTSEDIGKWLVCAPHIPGFDDISQPRIIDPDDGLFFPDSPQGYGLGLRTYTHRGVKVICHNGSIPGFAHQLTWLPENKVGFAMLSNSDLGGTYLRSLVACRFIENSAGLDKRHWKAVLDEKYKASTAPQSWMSPLPGTSTALETASSIAGKWSNPSFGTWSIAPEDIVPTRPALGSLPSLPGLCISRRLFTLISTSPGTAESQYQNKNSVGTAEDVYAACLECVIGGKVFYGYPFSAKVWGGRMEVVGLSGAEDAERDEACPLIFTKMD